MHSKPGASSGGEIKGFSGHQSVSTGTSGGNHSLPQLLPESGYIEPLWLKKYFCLRCVKYSHFSVRF